MHVRAIAASSSERLSVDKLHTAEARLAGDGWGSVVVVVVAVVELEPVLVI